MEMANNKVARPNSTTTTLLYPVDQAERHQPSKPSCKPSLLFSVGRAIHVEADPMSSSSKHHIICQAHGALKNEDGLQQGTLTLTGKKLIFAPSKQGAALINIINSRICGGTSPVAHANQKMAADTFPGRSVCKQTWHDGTE